MSRLLVAERRCPIQGGKLFPVDPFRRVFPFERHACLHGGPGGQVSIGADAMAPSPAGRERVGVEANAPLLRVFAACPAPALSCAPSHCAADRWHGGHPRTAAACPLLEVPVLVPVPVAVIPALWPAAVSAQERARSQRAGLAPRDGLLP